MKRIWITLLAGLLWTSGAAAEDACSSYGINAHLPSPSQLDDMKAAGFDWVRFDFNWRVRKRQTPWVRVAVPQKTVGFSGGGYTGDGSGGEAVEETGGYTTQYQAAPALPLWPLAGMLLLFVRRRPVKDLA